MEKPVPFAVEARAGTYPPEEAVLRVLGLRFLPRKGKVVYLGGRLSLGLVLPEGWQVERLSAREAARRKLSGERPLAASVHGPLPTWSRQGAIVRGPSGEAWHPPRRVPFLVWDGEKVQAKGSIETRRLLF